MTPAQCIEKYLIETVNMTPEAAATFAPDIVSALVEAGFQVGEASEANEQPSLKELIEVRSQAIDYALRCGASNMKTALEDAATCTAFMVSGGELTKLTINQQIDEGLLPARGQSG